MQFDASIAGQTIALSTGHIEINIGLTIEGPAPAGMTVSGGLVSQVFLIGQDGDVVFRNLSIVNGRTSFGGAMSVIGKAMLDHVLVANNEVTERGGGIYVPPTGNLTLVNSTVSGNIARVRGGGIASNNQTTIRNSTITGNVAGDAGGIYLNDGLVFLRNSIVANNVATGDASVAPNCEIGAAGSLLLSGTNLSSDASCGTGVGMVVANPQLALLASNGGPTKTHALSSSSPAIDGGSACSEATDQRYVARDQGTTCDIGAFEFNTFATLALTVGPNVAVNSKTGVATVTGTMNCSAPGAIYLDVSLDQTQKVTGKFTTIIQAAGATKVNCAGTSSWSVVLTPPTGKFESGSATGTANTTSTPGGFLAATVTSTLKLFNAK